MLQKEGDASTEICAALAAAFSEAQAPSQIKHSQSALSTALRRRSLDAVLSQLERIARGKDFTLPKDMVLQALSLAAREHRVGELVQRLAVLGGATLVDTSMINALLLEAARRRDTAY